MLQHANAQVPCYADVQRSGTAGQYVDEELVFMEWHASSVIESNEKQIPPLRCGMTNKDVFDDETGIYR